MGFRKAKRSYPEKQRNSAVKSSSARNKTFRSGSAFASEGSSNPSPKPSVSKPSKPVVHDTFLDLPDSKVLTSKSLDATDFDFDIDRDFVSQQDSEDANFSGKPKTQQGSVLKEPLDYKRFAGFLISVSAFLILVVSIGFFSGIFQSSSREVFAHNCNNDNLGFSWTFEQDSQTPLSATVSNINPNCVGLEMEILFTLQESYSFTDGSSSASVSTEVTGTSTEVPLGSLFTNHTSNQSSLQVSDLESTLVAFLD